MFARIATAFLIGGVVGWVFENALFYPRNANLFGRLPIPFLPIYGFGAATVVATAPYLRELPAVARAGIYAGELTLLEYGACHIDRALGPPSWDYDGNCVDVPHAILWGILGLGTEQLAMMNDKGATRELPL